MRGGRVRASLALTLRGYWWAVAVVACAAQLLMMGLVTVGVLVASSSDGGRDDLRAQQLLVVSLREGVLEQAGAIGDYASSGDPRLLMSYAEAGADVDAALGQLRDDTDGKPTAVPLALVGSTAGDWQNWAEGMRKQVASSRGPVRDGAAELEGERLLGRFTKAVEGLQSDLDRAQRAAGSDVARAWQLALAALWVGSLLVGAVLGGGMQMALGRSGGLAQDLAAAAREIARREAVPLPHGDRPDAP